MPVPGDPHGPWTHNTIMQMTMHGRYDGQAVVNALSFEVSAAKEAQFQNSDTERIDFCGDFASEWWTACSAAWLALFTPSYVLETQRVQVVECPNQISHRLAPAEISAQAPGTYNPAAGQPTSGTTAALIRWRTNIASRSHRGRSYIPTTNTAMLNAGAVSNTWMVQLAAFADAMINSFTGLGAETRGAHFTIYSRPYRYSAWTYSAGGRLLVKEVGPYDGNSTFVLVRSIDPNLRVQRRRERGVGA